VAKQNKHPVPDIVESCFNNASLWDDFSQLEIVF
jgi:hypothetical protein